MERWENTCKPNKVWKQKIRKMIMLTVAFAAAMLMMADEETVGDYTWMD